MELGFAWMYWYIHLMVTSCPFVEWIEYPIQPIPLVLPF